MEKVNVCLTYGRLDERHIDAIRSVSDRVALIRPAQGELGRALGEAHVVFGNIRPEDVEAAPHLRWIHIGTAGADRYARSALIKSRGITITNSSGCFGIPISEHVIAMMLALSRGIGQAMRAQARREWKRPPSLGEVYGKTAGILGLGDIGTEVARRAAAFGMRVLAMKRRPVDKPPFVDELVGPEGTDRVIEEADFLILCLPGTEKTRGILSAERIARMKPGSYVINIGRGLLIDEPALVEALRSGHLAGAGLDVFSQEPLPAESPLWGMENVLITPHTSGNSPEVPARSCAIFVRNLERFLRGEPLENVVDLEWGY